MNEITGFSYTMNWHEIPPLPGEYLVSIGAKGVGTIYFVKAIRTPRQRVLRDTITYSLTVVKMPELKPYTVYELTDEGANVWVKGVEAHSLFWNNREKKK